MTQNNQNKALVLIFILISSIVVLSGITVGQTTSTVSVADTSTSPGTSTSANVTVDSLPNGLQTYNVTVSLDNGTVGNITGTSANAISGRAFQVVNQSQNSVTFRASDLAGQVQSGASNINLATVDIAATTEGSSGISVTVNSLTNDNGNAVGPAVNNGQVTVQQTPFQGSVPGAGGQSPPADPNGDGLFEDVDGDGTADFDDAVALSFVSSGQLTTDQIDALDFDGDGDVDFNDAVNLSFAV